MIKIKLNMIKNKIRVNGGKTDKQSFLLMSNYTGCGYQDNSDIND